MTVGEIIACRRKELGLTLEDVGNAVGVGKSTVKKWESGYISNMGRDKIALLADVLRVDPLTFIYGEQRTKEEQTQMNEDRVLKAIGELSGKIDGRMDEFDKRLEAVEKKNRVTVDLAEKLFAHQRKQAEDIDELFRRLEEMRESPSAVWRSRDGREVGLDREDTYEMFRELGYGRREALKLIDLAGRLSRDDSKHYSKPVRIGGEIRRAIVILEKE